MSTPLTPQQQAFYLDGFLDALKNHRRVTIIGWAVTGSGMLGMFFGWLADPSRGYVLPVLSGLTITAGIVLVQQSLAMLQRYVTIPFPDDSSSGGAPAPSATLQTIRETMKDVERGGWQEAFEAVAVVEKIMREKVPGGKESRTGV